MCVCIATTPEVVSICQPTQHLRRGAGRWTKKRFVLHYTPYIFVFARKSVREPRPHPSASRVSRSLSLPQLCLSPSGGVWATGHWGVGGGGGSGSALWAKGSNLR